MKIKKFFKNEDGAVLPIVALLLTFVLIGLSALVIDVGFLYSERRSMVTAADAAALAGSQILEAALSDPAAVLSEVDSTAIKVAKDLAVANGVKNRDDVVVEIVRNNSEFHNVISVNVKNNYQLFFARILNFETSDVAAEAAATWGYTHKLEGGDILPIFTKDGDYLTASNTYLHSGKFVGDGSDIISGNWGLIDIYGNTSAIADAFAGETIGMKMELNTVIDNQTGLNAGNIENAIEDRMITANTLPTEEERVHFMSGLVPVIDWAHVQIQASQLKLPIKFFAVFEIYDVIVNNSGRGSTHALYDTADYKSDGIAVQYDASVEKTSIIGRFTGETVEIDAVVTPDDNVNPNPGALSVTYSQLIE